MLHLRIDLLLHSMNIEFSKDRHFNADQSRDLLGLIEKIEELKRFYKDLATPLVISELYANQFHYAKTFLAYSYGSTIPDDYKGMRVINNAPAFEINTELLVPTYEIASSSDAYTQLEKIEMRLRVGDYDGVLTSCNTLLESIMKFLYKDKTGNQLRGRKFTQKWDVFSQEFRLDINNKSASQKFGQILTGIHQIVTGIAILRNQISDSHSRDHSSTISKHHAVLVRNLTMSMAEFLLGSAKYQKPREESQRGSGYDFSSE